MPANTSKNKGSACRCDQNCGCCLKKKPATAAPAEPKLGFFGKRPWLYVVIAFMIMFTAWGFMFTLAIKYRPETVPLVMVQLPH